MMFYEDVKFKADYIMALKHLQQFEVNPLYYGTITVAQWNRLI